MASWRYEISLLVLKNIFFQHSKRNFVSPRGHVYILYLLIFTDFLVLLVFIRWIVIYPVDSAIHC